MVSETTQVSGVGSPAYMSPEQVREQTLNVQTDIFSLGVVMYQLLTGHLPFKANNNFGMVYQILNATPLPPSTIRAEVPAVVDRIALKALEKDLARRYASWGEFSADLASAFDDLQSIHEPVPETEKFNTLRSLAFFEGFGDVDLWQVVRISRWERFAAGTTVIREGDAGRSFFILASGDVRVTKNGRVLTARRCAPLGDRERDDRHHHHRDRRRGARRGDRDLPQPLQRRLPRAAGEPP